MEQLSVGCGILAAALHLVAYVTYIKQSRDGSSTPNILSWTIIAGLMWLNATSYLDMSSDLVKSLQAFSGAVASTVLLIDSLRRGAFYLPGFREGFVVVVGACAITIWRLHGNATYANLLAVGAMAIVFSSVIAGVYRDPRKEHPRAWVIWIIAFVFGWLTVALRYQGQPQDFAYPSSAIILDSLIVLLSRRSRKLRFRTVQTSTN